LWLDAGPVDPVGKLRSRRGRERITGAGVIGGGQTRRRPGDVLGDEDLSTVVCSSFVEDELDPRTRRRLTRSLHR
jgi:hypothetical protein